MRWPFVATAVAAAAVAILISTFPVCERVPRNDNDLHPRVVYDAGGIHRELMTVVSVVTAANLTRHCAQPYENHRVSVRGAAHTMGGHTMTGNVSASPGIQYDMTMFNKLIALDVADRSAVVEAGMTWHQLIHHINPHGLSPMAMQSFAAFSIGGSVSVNAHGIAGDLTVSQSVLNLTIMLANCTTVVCVPRDPLCKVAIGGYGAAGVIMYVGLRLVSNEKYNFRYTEHPIGEFWDAYRKVLLEPEVRVRYARLNLHTLDRVALATWSLADTNVVSALPVHEDGQGWFSPLIKWGVRMLALYPGALRGIRYAASETGSASMILGDTRNRILLGDLDPFTRYGNDDDKTYILQEYFVPRSEAETWMDKLLECLRTFPRTKQKLVNVTVRYVKADHRDAAWLSYTRDGRSMVAFVLFFCIGVDDDVDLEMLYHTHHELNHEAIALGGSFYLPYLRHYPLSHVFDAYGLNMYAFAAERLKFDPDLRFHNSLTRWFSVFK